MYLNWIFLGTGIGLLVKGGAWLVDGAVNVSRKAGISELAIGLTVVALGTSAPEFVVGIIGTISHNTELILGNIIGSNIANIFWLWV
ncbi:hypothetical protein IIB34_00390 [PVC group bacterium]|nr:hypothetical protein [PVC group bacterium]